MSFLWFPFIFSMGGVGTLILHEAATHPRHSYRKALGGDYLPTPLLATPSPF